MWDIFHNISECPFFFVHAIKPSQLGDAAKQNHQTLCHIVHQLGPGGKVVQNIVPWRKYAKFLIIISSANKVEQEDMFILWFHVFALVIIQ